MEKNTITQEYELYSIRPLLYRFDLMPNPTMCSDRPDIQIIIDGSLIGIEVIHYTAEWKAENLSIFNQMLRNYAKHFDDKRKIEYRYDQNRGYSIKVWLQHGDIPTFDCLRKQQERIYYELDSLLFAKNEAFIELKYIGDVEIDEFLDKEESEAAFYYTTWYEPLNEELFLKCIKKKNKKLFDYKQERKNEKIKEYWLAICFPGYEQVEIRDLRLTQEISTEFDKVFLVKGADCCQLL